MSDRDVRPLRPIPGRPIPSGFTYLPEERQEELRRQYRDMMRRLDPVFREMDQCRARAWASARNYVIG